MSTIVSKYSESTKSMSVTLFIALGLVLIANFLPAINESFFRCSLLKILIFTCLGYTGYVIIINSLPLVKQYKLDLLRDSLTGIRKCITYNVALLIFIIIFAYNVLFI